MKASINGVAVEGTPQEIMEYQRLQAEKAERKPFKSPSTADDGSILGITKITSGGTTTRCSGPCYCSGACETKTVIWDGKKVLPLY